MATTRAFPPSLEQKVIREFNREFHTVSFAPGSISLQSCLGGEKFQTHEHDAVEILQNRVGPR